MKCHLQILLIISLSACVPKEQTIPVEPDIRLHIKEDNHTAPLLVLIENNTKNALQYRWTFEGGIPSESSDRNPPVVKFESPGEHQIKLEAWNEDHRATKIVTLRVDSAVSANFEIEPIINNVAPADWNIKNGSSGGSAYNWTFEGGEPASFSGFNPPVVQYQKEGNYKISLTVHNGSAIFTTCKNISVAPPIDATFEIVPSFEDEDYEAPLHAVLSANLQGATSFYWYCNGGEIKKPENNPTTIFFPSAGDYDVILEVRNGKNRMSAIRQIHVKPNTNLRTHKDVMLGINTSGETIGYFYSTKHRRVLKVSEINQLPATDIDIAFLGLDKTFSRNKFISPDSCLYYPLKELAGASYTKFICKQQVLSPEDFIYMYNDKYFKNIDIKNSQMISNWFQLNTKQGDLFEKEVILFQTADNRKGAILVKEAVSNGPSDSYIIADIKIQKND